jgi:hypothetical protein
VTALDTARAGVYRIVPADADSTPEPSVPQAEGVEESRQEPRLVGVPFAVVPDLRESEDLSSFTDAQIDERLDFQPVHLLAGDDPAVFSGGERLNREWTVWLLAVLLAFTFVELLWAWVCGRAW